MYEEGAAVEQNDAAKKALNGMVYRPTHLCDVSKGRMEMKCMIHGKELKEHDLH